MQYRRREKILFKHCDPAGIVFFPRYFEMMNDMVEHFFDEALGTPFPELLQKGGVPTAQIETQFVRPSRHGDILDLALSITVLGRTSARYRMTGHCDGVLRFETNATLVNIARDGRPIPWPDALRARLKNYEGSDEP